MPKKIEGVYISQSAATRFRKWLVSKNLTVNRFSKECGCSRQYIEKIIHAEKKITPSVRALFKKGGYDLL